MAKPLKDFDHAGFLNSKAQVPGELPFSYSFVNGTDGDDVLFGTAGVDYMFGGKGADRMEGGKGDDQYAVDNVGDLVIERPGNSRNEKNTLPDGDTVVLQGSFDYTLPAHVETLLAVNFDVSTSPVFTGNNLDNLILGGYAASTVYGLGGNDTINVGGFSGGEAFGGEGNDTLTVSKGTLTGGPGADQFIAMQYGFDHNPNITDFNAAEGDTFLFFRSSGPVPSQAELIESGALRFDSATSTLSLDLPNDFYGAQLVHLVGVTSFDFEQVSVGLMA